MKEHSIDIQLSHPDDLFHLFGSNERHLRLMEEELDVVIHARTEIVQVLGEESACEEARQVIQALMVLVNRGMTVGTPDVVTAISMVKNDEIDKFVALYEEEIIKDNTGKPIRVKTLGQKLYVDSVKQHDVTFGIGPAGTGKTFLAVTLAVTALKRGQVKRIILTRPAVEAGESLGFLPGDLKERSILTLDPFMMPCIRFWEKTKRLVSWSVKLSRLRPLPTCVDGPWMMPLSFSMRLKIRPSCR